MFMFGAKHKKLLCLDFDGVIHSYNSGWKGARNIPDPPVPGALAFISGFIWQRCTLPDSIFALAPPGEWELAIFTSRARYFGGRRAIKKWLVRWGLDARLLEVIRFPLWKPSGTLLLDDRAIQFQGAFPEWEEIKNFKPWNKGKVINANSTPPQCR